MLKLTPCLLPLVDDPMLLLLDVLPYDVPFLFSISLQNSVKLLLEHGADLETRDPQTGNTPLLEAAAAGHEVIFQCLLNQVIHQARPEEDGG